MKSATFIVLMVTLLLSFLVTGIWCRTVGMEGDHLRAQQLLIDEGYTEIEVGGADAWQCDERDGVSNDFTATAPNGRSRAGVICCGYEACSKGCTIRWSK